MLLQRLLRSIMVMAPRTYSDPLSLFNHHDPQFAGAEVAKGSISISDGLTTLKDNGTDGKLISQGGQGFIDYASGSYYVIFANPPVEGSDIVATFEYNKPSSK